MKSSRLLNIYYLITLLLGTCLAIPVALFLNTNEIGARGAALMTLSWNVLFVMILPLVLDWSQRKHCQARFLDLEELAATNPELASAISEQCQKLSIPKLRLAVVDQASNEFFSYGLWGHNPRLIIPDKLLASQEKTVIVPSLEAELTRFTSQDTTMVFLFFTIFQVLLEQAIVVAF